MNAQPQSKLGEEGTVEPLRKQKEGELYTRPAAIEETIAAMMRLTKEEFVARIKTDEAPGNVPSEVLLYFVRRPPFNGDQSVLYELYAAIRQRVQRAVPVPRKRVPGQSKLSESVVDLSVRDAVLDRFQEMLCKDRMDYLDRLDYFECRFNAAVKRLRSTARRDVSKDFAHLSSLAIADDAIELASEGEKSLSCMRDTFDGPKTDFLYRSKIHSAISSLPPDERQVIELFLEDVPIDSKEEATMTMVKIIGCSEKTVRNRRDRAFAKLTLLLKEEDVQ